MTELSFILNSPSESNLYSTLNELDQETNQLKAGVAFVTKPGLDSFQSAVNSVIADRTQKWIVSINGGITQPEALRALSKQAQTEVRIANGKEMLKGETLTSSSHFHPKLVWFDRSSEHDLMTGSANFTQRGFYSNWETCVLVENIGVKKNGSLIESLESWWNDAWSSALPVDSDAIEKYSSVRDAYIDRTPPDYLRRIKDRETALENANILWAEVETVMGGNDQQFEVPKPCLQFFTRESTSLSVGEQTHVTFVYEGIDYTGRSIRLHQNQMCRINLPNSLGKRFDLTNYSIIIEYLNSGRFKIDLIPDDEQAQTLEPLRNESSQRGQVLTMDRKDREYGWM